MISLPKSYLHDKLILLLASGNIFATFLCAALIFLRLNVGQGSEGYIVQYRSNLGTISPFKTGGVSGILSFVIFAFMVMLFTIGLSMSVYKIRRELAITTLASGLLLVVLAIVVSNALMVLH